MQVAQFVHRYPPALGGAEAYTARLCEYLAARGDDVRVWTTTAVELEEMWRSGEPRPPRRGLSGDPVVESYPRPGGRGSPVSVAEFAEDAVEVAGGLAEHLQ